MVLEVAHHSVRRPPWIRRGTYDGDPPRPSQRLERTLAVEHGHRPRALLEVEHVTRSEMFVGAQAVLSFS